MAASLSAAVIKIGTRFFFQFRTLNSFKVIHNRNSLHRFACMQYFFEQSTRRKIFNGRLFSTLQERKCWKCGCPTDGEKELFFCNCGVVQSVPSDLSFFKVMNCEEKFDINTESLAILYKELQRRLHPDKFSQCSKVRHSQRMNETALKPWVIVDKTGEIDAAHCDCMAGLGEACSHVGALLFYLEAATRINAAKTVTQEKAYWLLPTSIDKVPYSKVREIDFMSAETKKRKLDAVIDGETDDNPRNSLKLPNIPEPSQSEKDNLLSALFQSGSNASILTVSAEYQKHFMPEILQDGQLPEPFINLRDEKYIMMPADELQKECEVIFDNISVTEKQCENVQKITREQSKCKEWHRLRMGRITASNMKSVCTTSIEKPALSTVKSICGQNKFKTKATDYSCRNEQEALQDYSKLMKCHENVKVMPCGLFLSPEYPFLGATPDALISCSFCGQGIVEIKCLYCAKNNLLSDCAIECLQNGSLKPGHRYKYQVQTQLTVTKKEYCDFVIRSSKDISVQRILTNQTLENEILEKSKNFFIKVILPELTGCLITREREILSQNNDVSNLATKCTKTSSVHVHQTVKLNNLTSKCKKTTSMNYTDKLSCICGVQCKEILTNVIRCDNENCQYGILHFKCVNLKRRPKSPYYCPECRKYKW